MTSKLTETMKQAKKLFENIQSNGFWILDSDTNEQIDGPFDTQAAAQAELERLGGEGISGKIHNDAYDPAKTNGHDGPLFPDVKLKLAGEEGNAFAILGRAVQAAKGKIPDDKLAEFKKEAQSGDYDNLLRTCMKWFDCDSPTHEHGEGYCDHCGDSLNQYGDCDACEGDEYVFEDFNSEKLALIDSKASKKIISLSDRLEDEMKTCLNDLAADLEALVDDGVLTDKQYEQKIAVLRQRIKKNITHTVSIFQ